MLEITDEGKQCVYDYKSIHRAILLVLTDGPHKMRDLVIEIQTRFTEFKNLKLTIIVNAIGDLMKSKLINSTYRFEEE